MIIHENDIKYIHVNHRIYIAEINCHLLETVIDKENTSARQEQLDRLVPLVCHYVVIVFQYL